MRISDRKFGISNLPLLSSIVVVDLLRGESGKIGPLRASAILDGLDPIAGRLRGGGFAEFLDDPFVAGEGGLDLS